MGRLTNHLWFCSSTLYVHILLDLLQGRLHPAEVNDIHLILLQGFVSSANFDIMSSANFAR